MRKRILILAAGALLGTLLFAWQGFDARAQSGALPVSGKRTPVVVELFTSEGCSSCPPADRLLAQLDAEQPVPGAEILVLGWHVDYWDHLGWRDAFSSGEYTARQQAYAHSFGTSGVYTPQMVVDGQTEFVGSNASQARQAIARAASQPKARLMIVANMNGQNVMGIAASVTHWPAALQTERAEAVLVIVENNLASRVTRGENSGRTLQHRSVVRALMRLGDVEVAQVASFSRETTIPLKKEWKREDLRAVVFLQAKRSRRVLGATSLRLTAQ